jgi:MoaA/NifB/PqqE/SkfB family radical SAM enzyme
LGRISQGEDSDSLHSIWSGVRLQAQRDALDAGDFSLGCSECRQGVAAGNRGLILARDFDRFWDVVDTDYPSYMDFALSNTCNLQCVMCNGDLSSAIRSRREHRPPLESAYGDAFFEELVEFLPHLREASFKGGEPFLSREVRRVWDEMMRIGVRPRTTVTTNGTQWSDRIAEYVQWFGMHVILSVDGHSAGTVESIRVGVRHEAMLENIERFRQATQASGGSLVLNYCLMPQNWHELGAFLADAERRELWVHVIPVVAPPRFDLQQLPREELRSIVAALEREDRTSRDLFGRNESVWVAVLDRLRRHLASPDAVAAPPSPVEVASPGRRRGERRSSGRRTDQRVCRDLTKWAGRRPLTIEVIDDTIQAVHAPRWAEELLAPSSWVGISTERIPELIGHRLGVTPPDVDLDVIEELLIASFEVDLDGEPVAFRAVILGSVGIGGRIGQVVHLTACGALPGSPTARDHVV